MRNRREILPLLAELPEAVIAGHAEVLQLVESERLFGAGMGWIDTHLIASALLTKTGLITRDKALAKVVGSIGIGSTS
jgi:hypothetical protein